MRKAVTAVFLVLALQAPARAQSVEDLSKAAVDAAMSYMAGTIMCADIIGSSYISVGRMMLEDAVRAHGVTGDALTIQVDDLEQHLRQQQGDRNLQSIIGQNGVTEMDVMISCQDQLSEGLRATEVATARYRQATGQ